MASATTDPSTEYHDLAYNLQRAAVGHALLALSAAYLALTIQEASAAELSQSILAVRAASAGVPLVLYLVIQRDVLNPRAARRAILGLLVLLACGSHLALRLPRASSGAAAIATASEPHELTALYLTAYAVLVPGLPLRAVGGTVLCLYALQFLLLIAADGRLLLLRELAKSFGVNALGWAVGVAAERAHRANFELARRFKVEMAEHDRAVGGVHQLLMNTLPHPVVVEIASGSKTIAHRYEDVTVLQADMVGFTSLSASNSPGQMLNILGELFHEFDALTETLGVHKLKTIGDAYIVCCGAFGEAEGETEEMVGEAAARRVVRMGLSMQEVVADKAKELGVDIGVRVGVHTGKVMGGIIGTVRFHFDMWGNGVSG